jgi:hypothetical protein
LRRRVGRGSEKPTAVAGGYPLVGIGVGVTKTSATFASVGRIEPSRLTSFDEDEAVLGEF